MQKTSLINLNISLGSYRNFCENIVQMSECSRSEYVCVTNVHMLIEMFKNRDFANIVNSAAIATPDGLPLTWALKWLHGIKQERVAGMDLLPDLLSEASQGKMPVFFYGSTEQVLDKTKAYIRDNYPGIPYVSTYSPPFRPLTEEEHEWVIQHINASGAKLVFVALGCPKQERWMASMRGKINAVMVGIGGALPVLVGEQQRAPLWMQKSGLEWFYRFCQEPQRLWKRYLLTNSMFLFLLLKTKLKMITGGNSEIEQFA